jgi:hypothetical protein
MDRLATILVLILFGQGAIGQKSDTLITHNQFIGIKLGETNFKDAADILKAYSYKEPILNFRSIKWRDGGCTTLRTHHYFVKIEKSRLAVILYGYTTVDRIRISSNTRTKLSFHNLTLGASRIRDIEFADDKWEETIYANGKVYLTNEFKGIKIDIPGDSLDVENKNWINKKINQITLTKAPE